jgi:hypothetical protein
MLLKNGFSRPAGSRRRMLSVIFRRDFAVPANSFVLKNAMWVGAMDVGVRLPISPEKGRAGLVGQDSARAPMVMRR